MSYLSTSLYRSNSQLQEKVDIFINFGFSLCRPEWKVDVFVNFGIFCRAPVMILFQFNTQRVGGYPSSLSTQNVRADHAKHHADARKNKKQCGGFWLLLWVLSLFAFKIKEQNCEYVIIQHKTARFYLILFCIFCVVLLY